MYCLSVFIVDFFSGRQITLEEMQEVFVKLKSENKIKQSEIQALVRAADKDRSGTINFKVN